MIIWNLKSRQLEAVLRNNNTPAYLIETSSDSKHIVSAHDDNSIKIWNIQDRVLEDIFKGYFSRINCIEISNGNKYIVSAHSINIMIWNFLDKIPDAILIHCSVNNFFAITNNGKYLALSGAYHNLILWSLEDNAKEATFEGHTKRISWIKTTYECKYLISSSTDMTLRLWNIQAKKVEAILHLELFSIPRFLIMHQAWYIIFNTTDKNMITWINQPQIEHLNIDQALEIAGMTGDNKYSVYTDKSIIELWINLSLDKIRKSDHHTHPYSCIAIASDNKYIRCTHCQVIS